MFLYLLLAIWVIYAVYIVRYVHFQIHDFLKRSAEIDPAVNEKYHCIYRKDMHKWNHLEMYFSAVFLLPIRMIQLISCFLMGVVLVKVALFGTPKGQVTQSLIRRTVIKATLQVLARSALFALGFYHVNRKHIDMWDIDPTYPKGKKTTKLAPLVVSNHPSLLDIMIHVSGEHVPSFMSKASISEYPLIGDIGKGLQCLFIDIYNKDSRNAVLPKIQERIAAHNNAPDETPPLLIFPEGTTNNGEYVLSFKKGAFCNFAPVHVTALKYHGTRFSPAFDTIGAGRSILFTMLQISNGLTVYDMGVYDPSHLNLKEEADWEIYAGKVKNVIVKALGSKSCEHGLAHAAEYFKIFYPEPVKLVKEKKE